MLKRWIPFLVFLIPAFVLAQAQPAVDLGPKFKEAISKAEKAAKAGDEDTAEFWMARYLGLCSAEEGEKHNESDLYPLMERLGIKDYTSIFNSHFSPSFEQFFFGMANSLWDVPDENFLPQQKSFKVKPTTSGDGGYFVIPVMKPVFQVWLDIKDKNRVTPPLGRTLVLKPGRILGGDKLDFYADTTVPLEEWSFIQFLWYPEFHDLDGDGIPELWVRYNQTIANGFVQVLDIYKFDNEKKQIKLIRRFEGDTEGIARRLKGNRVEVASGCTDEKGNGHLGLEKHCFELWEYKNGDFVKTKEWKVPNLLWSKAWEPYYKQGDE